MAARVRRRPARACRISARRAALVAVGTVAGVTWGLLAVDLLLGGRMTMLSVLGLLPLDGGRFHGFGNVPFAIFVAAAFFLMAALASPFVAAGRRRTAALVVAVVGGATFVVDAWRGTPTNLAPDEHDDLAWIDPGTLGSLRLAHPGLVPLVTTAMSR